MKEPFTVVAAVNNDEILRKNLLMSPTLMEDGNQLLTKEGFSSASLAYNSAIDEAQNDLIVFVHQDIYFPEGWFENLAALHRGARSSTRSLGGAGLFWL